MDWTFVEESPTKFRIIGEAGGTICIVDTRVKAAIICAGVDKLTTDEAEKIIDKNKGIKDVEGKLP